MGKILIVTAVESEREAVLRGLAGDDRVDVIAGGVGAAAAAASTASAIARAQLNGEPYELAISAGIGGGFAGQAEIGWLVVASSIIAADLGVETADGFQRVDELGFGSSVIAVDRQLASRAADALAQAGLPAVSGPILTVTTATGTALTAEELAVRVPGAAAEAMEGYGVAIAAQQLGVPVLELRAISNAVGPRDRAAWRIGDALEALASASSIWKEIIT